MTDYQEQLRYRLAEFFGRSITKQADCADLSDDIKSATGQTISYMTLCRFFDVVHSKSQTNGRTLNILCNYLGFRDMQDFIAHQNDRHDKASDIDFTAIQSVFNKSSEYADNWLFWHEKIIALLAEIILTNESAFENFVDRMHDNPGAMQYIMATFQMWDNLSKDWYMRGLRLFCRHSKVFHHKMYLAAKEFLACLLTDKLDDTAPYIKTIKENLPAFKEKYGNTLLPLEGALYAELIIDAHYHNRPDEMNDYFNQAMCIMEQNQNTPIPYENRESYEGFPINLCTKLNCYGLYELTLEVIKRYNVQENKKYQWHKTARVQIDIMKSTAYFQAGSKPKSKKIYEAITIDHLNFDRKNIITIQYLLLKLGFTPKRATIQRKKIKQQMEQIIAQTGMVIFNRHIPKFE